MLLSEVALGRPHELLSADYNGHNLPKGKHSVKGLGKLAPDPSKSSTMSVFTPITSDSFLFFSLKSLVYSFSVHPAFPLIVPS